jgi:hypothetical protein
VKFALRLDGLHPDHNGEFFLSTENLTSRGAREVERLATGSGFSYRQTNSASYACS